MTGPEQRTEIVQPVQNRKLLVIVHPCVTFNNGNRHATYDFAEARISTLRLTTWG